MAVTTEQVAEQFINVTNGAVLPCDFPAFDSPSVHVLYGNAGFEDAVDGVDYDLTLGDENNDYSFSITVRPALITKINNMIAADGTETNRVVVRRVMSYTTVSTPGAVSGTKFTSQEFDRVSMKLMQIADRNNRGVVLGDQYVDEDPPLLTLGDEGEFLTFGPNNTIIPGPSSTGIENAAANAAATAADRVQTGLDRVATAADRVQTGIDAASALASKNIALQTKGIFHGAWLTATAYAKYDQVRSGTVVYSCDVAHTSGTFATDLSAGKWEVYLQDGPSGAGSGDMAKATYDPTNKNGDAFSMANMVESGAGSGHLKMTTAERSKLTGIEAGANVTDAANIYTSLNGATTTTPVVGDYLPFIDDSTNSMRKNTISALITLIRSVLDSVYAGDFAPISHSHSFSSITSKPTTRSGYGLTDAAPLAPSAGAVGSYALLRRSSGASFDPGDTVAGSGLYYNTTEASVPGGAPNASGTWRAMGYSDGGAGDQTTTVWLRIS